LLPRSQYAWVALALALCACVVNPVDYSGTQFSCVEEVCPGDLVCVNDVCVEPGGQGDGGVSAFERELTVDNSASAGGLDNFPLLVRLDSSRIEYAVCEPDGRDLKFTDADGTALPREIERWDPSGVSIVWVNVGRIEATASGAVLTMRYGDGVPVADDPTAVWSEFAAVYHLADGSDSSPSDFDGTVSGAPPIEGPVGPALNFRGNGDYVDLGRDRPFLRAQTAATSSAWARLASGFVGPGVIFATSIDNGGLPTNSSRLQMLVLVDRTLNSSARSLDSGPSAEILGPVLSEGVWVHITHTVDFAADRMELFVDGLSVATETALGLEAASADSVSTQTVIGRGDRIDDIDQYDGDIDEVRLIHRVRSADEIAADYRGSADQLVGFGPAVVVP